jgi:aspartate--ammonia ligase
MSDADRKVGLAGPDAGKYGEVGKMLPADYRSALTPMETMRAVFEVKSYVERHLCRELNLKMVQAPLIVTRESGVNDTLDRDGSHTAVGFPCGLGIDPPLNAEVVQAVTKWKRLALAQFGCEAGEGVCTDMRAVRKDYFLDHDHSAYVDQWDWERVITAADRNLDFLKDVVRGIWEVIVGARRHLEAVFPRFRDDPYGAIPQELTFIHAEELLDRYPDLTPMQRETAILQDHPAVFIIGLGYPLQDGHPHDMRATDYDDWITATTPKAGPARHGLNGDIVVWNPVTKTRHELTSMGIRVTKQTLVKQMEMAGPIESLQLPYHQAIMNDRVPLSIGGGIGQARTHMYLLRKAHIGEVSVGVWPQQLRDICTQRNIFLLE